jgi:hypothetical protein
VFILYTKGGKMGDGREGRDGRLKERGKIMDESVEKTQIYLYKTEVKYFRDVQN